MKFRWSVAPAQPMLAMQLAKGAGITQLLSQCLLNRGLSVPEQISGFLQPRLKQLADPFLLPDMDRAVDRLFRARSGNEPVVIFGDYDVDGVTSSAILLESLRGLGWNVQCYLPHRMEEGYGLSRDALETCLKRHPARLLIAVDCGSTSVESIQWLNGQNVDVIVLDHHQVSNPAPEPVALVNPQRALANSHGLFTELCSAGLAFKLAHALVKHGRDTGLACAADLDVRLMLDLVALGTIADVVPLNGENRILVSAGLERLNATKRPGLIALKQVAQMAAKIGTYEVGFQFGPRLNAAGRLENAEEALQLLMARDMDEAMPLAQSLDASNRERQKIERGILETVVGDVRARFNAETDFVIVEGRLPWHIGVVGIVASRVLQEFYRPTIIMGGEGTDWRGSGRSIAGFDLAAALRECGDLLVRHGGHAMAAGLSVSAANFEAFRRRLNDIARRTLKPELLERPLRLDAEVGLNEMTREAVEDLGRLAPTGQGNPGVQYCSRNVTHSRPLQRMGADKQHVKMWVTDGSISHEAVWWGGGKESLPVDRFDLAFAPQINDFRSQRTVQLKVLDWRPA